MQVADHFSAVKRRFESRAMPAYEKPPAKLVDIYLRNIIDHLTQYPYEYMFEVQLCVQ